MLKTNKKPCWNCRRLTTDHKDVEGDYMCEPCKRKFDNSLGTKWSKGVFLAKDVVLTADIVHDALQDKLTGDEKWVRIQ